MDQMKDAEHALLDAAKTIPPQVCARFETAAKLSDEDRKLVIQIACQALERFQTKPEPAVTSGVEPEPRQKSKPKLQAALKENS